MLRSNDYVRRFSLGLLAAVATSMATAADAKPASVWARPDTSISVMAADYGECVQQSKKVQPGIGGSFPIVMGVVPGLIEGAIASASEVIESHSYIAGCMHYRGYRAVPLSADESTYLDKQTTPDAKIAWVGALYNRDDFAGRLASITVASLPDLKDEPLSYEAIRFDPSRLAPATSAVKAKGVVLSGPVTYRDVAQLTNTVNVGDGHVLPAGAIFYATQLPVGTTGYMSYWCAEGLCLRDNNGGYFIASARGKSWAATGIGRFAGKSVNYDIQLRLAPVDAASQAPLGLELAIQDITPSRIDLDAVLSRGDERETIWSGALPVGPDGRAALPFWSHRLVMTLTNGGVTVSFLPNGNSQGWPHPLR